MRLNQQGYIHSNVENMRDEDISNLLKEMDVKKLGSMRQNIDRVSSTRQHVQTQKSKSLTPLTKRSMKISIGKIFNQEKY